MKEKKLLVIGHEIFLEPDAERKLERAGYIVLRGDPDAVKALVPVPIAQHDAILDSALRAIGDASFDDVRQKFAKYVIKAVLPDVAAKVTPKPAPKKVEP